LLRIPFGKLIAAPLQRITFREYEARLARKPNDSERATTTTCQALTILKATVETGQGIILSFAGTAYTTANQA